MNLRIARPNLGRVIPDTMSGRLAAVLSPLFVALVAVALAAAWQARQQTDDIHDTRVAFETTSAVQSAALTWLYADTLAGRYIVAPSPELKAAVHLTEQIALAQLDTAHESEASQGHLDHIESMVAIKAQRDRGIVSRQQALDAADAGRPVEARQILLQGVTDAESVSDAFTRLIASETQVVHDSSTRSQATAAIVMWILAVAVIAVILSGIVTALTIVSSVVRPLSNLRKAAAVISGGDLSPRAIASGPREIRELAAAGNLMLATIQERNSALNESMERWQALIENSHDLIIVLDRDFSIAFVNPVVEQMLGYKVNELVGSDSLAFVHPEDSVELTSALGNVAAGIRESLVAEARVLRADGSYAHLEGISSKIQWGDHEAILLNARDVSEQKQAQQEIEFMAFHDSLTGLPNRTLLQDRLDTAISDARHAGVGVCVMSVDLDRFKNVNDLLGHNAGDDLLKQVASRLSELARSGDTVARIGGDEFIVVLPECESPAAAREAARRFVEGFRRPFSVAGQEIHITISAGYAYSPDHALDAETLVSNADIALYMAKDSGRDTYRAYSEDVAKRTSEWFDLERELRRALLDGGIEAYYQPQVRVRTGEVIGAEALARWRHPYRGLLAPGEFIPLAEETGLITLLDELILRQACAEALNWPEHMRVAVNVSPRQFESPDFLERTFAIVRDTGLPFGRLELEITESTAIRDFDRTRDITSRLGEAGIQVAIDDFGIGNTSLRYLQQLPVHRLKIDQTFMLTLGDNPASAAIAASVISLGHKLNLKVIAEGVETEEALEFLRKQKCDDFQGFLCSPPVPAKQFHAIIAKNLATVTA